MKYLKVILVISAIYALPLSVQAQILVGFNFPIGTTPGPTSATTTDPTIIVGAMNSTGTPSGPDTYYSERTYAFTTGGDGSAVSASQPNLGKYVSFDLQATTGYALDLTSLQFYASISEAGSPQIDVMYSTDGFVTSTDLGSAAISNNIMGTGTKLTLDLSALQNVTSDVSFRFYFYGAQNGYETTALGNANGATGIDSNGDGLVVFGSSVSTVPEPSTWALMIAGLGLLVFFSRRARHLTN
jgi:hypothetical protein